MKLSFIKHLLGALGLLTGLLCCGQAGAQQNEPHNGGLPQKETSMETDKEILVEGGFKKILSDLIQLESIESIEKWVDYDKYRYKSSEGNSKFDFNERLKNIQNNGLHVVYDKRKDINLIVAEIENWETNKITNSNAGAKDFGIMIKIKSDTNYLDIFISGTANNKSAEPKIFPFYIKSNKTNKYDKCLFGISEYSLFYGIFTTKFY